MDVPKMLLPSLSMPRSETETHEFVFVNCSRRIKKNMENLSVTSKLLTVDYAKKRNKLDFFLFGKRFRFLI